MSYRISAAAWSASAGVAHPTLAVDAATEAIDAAADAVAEASNVAVAAETARDQVDDSILWGRGGGF